MHGILALRIRFVKGSRTASEGLCPGRLDYGAKIVSPVLSFPLDPCSQPHRRMHSLWHCIPSM